MRDQVGHVLLFLVPQCYRMSAAVDRRDYDCHVGSTIVRGADAGPEEAGISTSSTYRSP